MNGYNSTEIGNRIREIRKKLGLSMEEFANRIDGKAKSGTVSNWETGKNLPNNNRLKRIGELGNVSTLYLLEGKKTLSDMEKAGEKIPLMESRTLEERERIESVISYTRNFLENFNDYETLDVWAINNLFRNLETLKANDKNNPQLGEQTRDFLTVFLQDLNKKIKNNPDSDLNNLYKEILELLNS